VALSVCGAVPAFAFDEAGTSDDPSNCLACHGDDAVSVESTGQARQGPHGGYTTSTNKCAACHGTHNAPADGFVLLLGPTITDGCEVCHDGTGAGGVYGVLASRGVTVTAAHRTEVTNIVPGGDAASGGTTTTVFGGPTAKLSCGDCHSPHGNHLVAPFTGDRMRVATATPAAYLSARLLKRKPTSSDTETAVYGSAWCSGCHKGRAAGVHAVINHSVEETHAAGAFYYESVQIVDGVNSSNTASGTLGRNNFGYVMPWERTTGQGTHKPICQQCHEDVRNVGDQSVGRISASEVFAVTSLDGGAASDNPRFQVFPHESGNVAMLLETGDDLCTNCHHSSQLP
jgi:hypothetical protein